MIRRGGAQDSTHPFVYREHRIARPQNPFFESGGAPTPSSNLMLFTNGDTMLFTVDQDRMEFTS